MTSVLGAVHFSVKTMLAGPVILVFKFKAGKIHLQFNAGRKQIISSAAKSNCVFRISGSSSLDMRLRVIGTPSRQLP